MFYCPAGIGRDGTGRTGVDQKCPLNFFAFKYVNNYVIKKNLDVKKLSTIFYGFEIGGGGELFLKLKYIHEY